MYIINSCFLKPNHHLIKEVNEFVYKYSDGFLLLLLIPEENL